MGKSRSLLEQIETDALDESVDVAAALRKCIALGSATGSAPLREWANLELRGYQADVEIPEYRIVQAPIVIDGVSGQIKITGQQISSFDLPDFVREEGYSERCTLYSGIGELEELVRRAREGESIRIGLPGNDLIAKVMTRQMQGYVERIYWNVAPVAVHGVIDQIRTRLVELVAQIKANTGEVGTPASDVVTNAVDVSVYGRGHRVTVNTAQASGSGPASIMEAGSKEPAWWRTTKGLAAIAGGIAAVVAAVIAWLQWK